MFSKQTEPGQERNESWQRAQFAPRPGRQYPVRTHARSLGAIAVGAAAVASLVGLSVPIGQYSDGIGGKQQAGRTKNSIAAVISGIVAQKAVGDCSIDLQVEKTFFPDAHIFGVITNNSIDVTTDLLWHDAHFSARIDQEGRISGHVDKSEFDWDIKQHDETTWVIERFGWKFDYTLHLEVRDGSISGTLERPAAIDWNITGTIIPDGRIHVTVDGPLTMGISLAGTITPAASSTPP